MPISVHSVFSGGRHLSAKIYIPGAQHSTCRAQQLSEIENWLFQFTDGNPEDSERDNDCPNSQVLEKAVQEPN